MSQKQRPSTIHQLRADTDRALVGEEESDSESDSSDDSSDEENNNIRQEPTPTTTPPPNNCTDLYKLLEEKLAGFKNQLDEQALQIEELKKGQKTNGPNEHQRRPETSLAKTQPRQSKEPKQRDKTLTSRSWCHKHDVSMDSSTMEKEKPWTLVTRKKTGRNGIDRFKAQIEKQDEKERQRVLERMISGRNAKPGYRRLSSILVKGISRQSVNQVQKILAMMVTNFATARFQNNSVCELVIYDAEEEYKRIFGLASHTEVITIKSNHNVLSLNHNQIKLVINIDLSWDSQKPCLIFTNRRLTANTRRTFLESWRDSLPPAKFFNLARAFFNFEMKKLSADKAEETLPTPPEEDVTEDRRNPIIYLKQQHRPPHSNRDKNISPNRHNPFLKATRGDHIVIAAYLSPDEPISAIKEEFQALSPLLPSTSVLLGNFNMGLSAGSDARNQVWIGQHTFKLIEATTISPLPVATDTRASSCRSQKMDASSVMVPPESNIEQKH
ncbi:hypothetical protein SeLEV6574_g02856 [Synchytrium endobioticum]|uniref:Endonuclease/exonuclease/phosphatase domain-containing protein n=1 Tax=Synchytrium endobioticum TaxID=286115 RepID=A0A507D6J8_9FUNG|nr:hypothetical protein SeLEV6574_g02856 [Synchytrium endobioticum]